MHFSRHMNTPESNSRSSLRHLKATTETQTFSTTRCLLRLAVCFPIFSRVDACSSVLTLMGNGHLVLHYTCRPLDDKTAST